MTTHGGSDLLVVVLRFKMHKAEQCSSVIRRVKQGCSVNIDEIAVLTRAFPRTVESGIRDCRRWDVISRPHWLDQPEEIKRKNQGDRPTFATYVLPIKGMARD